MLVQWPNEKNLIKMMVKLLPNFAIGYLVYYVSENVLFGVLVFILMLVVVVKVKRYSLNSQFIKYLERIGEEFGGDYSLKLHESEIMGFVPFNGQYAHCSVYADESGIVLRKRRIKRYIPWSSVLNYQLKRYLGHSIIELSLKSREENDRVIVPWNDKFNEYLSLI
ncbi:hypothetical protein [Teredinibacter sp. KSP-S5-2]|uniref:hypothetical protein n=1 Tax=Teredinibacter sp. KSP-S5-2 TaxID=3034506 RepID=UPI0029350234|nr:hypothetical protein [Teredinibacter sp. KSP-S5-2]WNO09537.1 hypothetical protein P5V12_21600 [Teredinibacter sp. KSP-S5-2]